MFLSCYIGQPSGMFNMLVFPTHYFIFLLIGFGLLCSPCFFSVFTPRFVCFLICPPSLAASPLQHIGWPIFQRAVQWRQLDSCLQSTVGRSPVSGSVGHAEKKVSPFILHSFSLVPDSHMSKAHEDNLTPPSQAEGKKSRQFKNKNSVNVWLVWFFRDFLKCLPLFAFWK